MTDFDNLQIKLYDSESINKMKCELPFVMFDVGFYENVLFAERNGCGLIRR